MSAEIDAAPVARFSALGLAALQRGEIGSAVTHYQSALALAPNNAELLHALGVSLMRQLRIDEALRYLRQAIELSHGQVPAYKQNFGWALGLLMVPLPTMRALDTAELAMMQRMLHDCIERIVASDRAPNAPLALLRPDEIGWLRTALRSGLAVALPAEVLYAIARWVWADAARTPLPDDGVEFVGFARAAIGLGENLRALVRAVALTPLAPNISVRPVPLNQSVQDDDRSVDSFIDGRHFAVQIVCVNPDLLSFAFEHLTLCRYPQVYRVGFWFWELERMPRHWMEKAQWCDEIWAATDFVADAIRRDVTDRPVIKMRTPVLAPTLERHYSRAEFGLREDCCLFMFSFSYASFASRKNPHATIRAFQLAFPLGTESVQLLIKSSPNDLFAGVHDGLVRLTAADPRIIFIHQHLTREQISGLQSTIDCYVSLHRSEGLGLGLAECMAQGKPVIATGYSGNLEFMNAHNSFLVDYELIAVQPGEYPDHNEQVWANPSTAHAAALMRGVYDDPEHTRAVGRRGAQHIAEHFSPTATGHSIVERYQLIRALPHRVPNTNKAH